ncbi:MAG: RsmB/NOP family class I SAM-dependent RNA methyltransferase [Methylobacillus sp.]|jgi:16S rRNA (cytosine967-C5)-methyltransferase|nr:RsmB/NOP family class I SAM-dependent RNA methyltransferase [Methylobacillus sp.]
MTNPINETLMRQAAMALAMALVPNGPADAKLGAFFREHPKLGVKDRAFVAESVYQVLRRKRLLEYLADGDDPRRLLLASLLRLQGISLRDLAPLLNKQQTEWAHAIKAKSTENLPLAIQADFPDWLWERLLEQYGEPEALALARSLHKQAPLDIRVNTVKATREEVLEQFGKDRIAAAPTPYSPNGLRMESKIMLSRQPMFLDGKIEVQDEGSQLLAHLVAPRRGEMVADFCAGAGGKSLALGALMRNTGRLYAFDVSEKRLHNLGQRLKRSGLSNLHSQRIANERDAKLKRLIAKFDRVLVDAPCSGLGTLRRNPDLKWRQTPQDVVELTAKQGAILQSAARLVKPGGRLVYATCSLLREENEAIVEAFLAAHPEFELSNTAEILAQQQIPLDTGAYFKLLPHVHATDGFFAAALTRKMTA